MERAAGLDCLTQGPGCQGFRGEIARLTGSPFIPDNFA